MVKTEPYLAWNTTTVQPQASSCISMFPMRLTVLSMGPAKAGWATLIWAPNTIFLQEIDNGPMVGIFPIVVTHRGNPNKGLGNGCTQLFLPV